MNAHLCTEPARRKLLLLHADFIMALRLARELQRLGCRILGPTGSALEAVTCSTAPGPTWRCSSRRCPSRSSSR
jgi:hypothetical protein